MRSWSYGRFRALEQRYGMPRDRCLQSSNKLGVELQELMLADRRPADDHVVRDIQFPSVEFDIHDISLRTHERAKVTASTLWRLRSTTTLTRSLDLVKPLGTTSTLRRLRSNSFELHECGQRAQLTEFAALRRRRIEADSATVGAGATCVALTLRLGRLSTTKLYC